eukprot:8476877-Pyramimonas_sp.AAC.1
MSSRRGSERYGRRSDDNPQGCRPLQLAVQGPEIGELLWRQRAGGICPPVLLHGDGLHRVQ